LNNFDKLRYKVYKRKVLNITKQQPIQLLENCELRGRKGYHLDHIYPIKLGFINKIEPEVIGNINNLRFIPYKQNLKKSSKDVVGMHQYIIEEMI